MTGHLRRRGERSWELKFDAERDPITGKRRTRYTSFKGTKREAEIEWVAEHAAGASVDPSKISVSDFLAKWQDDFVALHVTPKTGERYKQLIKIRSSRTSDRSNFKSIARTILLTCTPSC